MVTILTVLHVVVCVFLIIIVLLQHGKGADMGASFGGGGGGQTVFGTDGPLPLLTKITTASAVLFMITSVSLAYYSANISKGSVMENVRQAPAPVEQQMEVAPTEVEIPMQRSTGDDGQTDPASATFPGDASATFPGEASTDPVPVNIEETPPAKTE